MPRKPKKTTKLTPKDITPPPLDIGLPKSGLVTGKKVMDIVPTGKAMPSSSSGPIIVSNRTIVKDPMAPPELPTDEAKKPVKKTKTKSKILKPLRKKIVSPKVSDATAKQDSEFFADPEVTPAEEVGAPLETKTGIQEKPKSEAKPDTAPEVDLASQEAEEPAAEKAATRDEGYDTSKDNEVSDNSDETTDDIQKSTQPKPEDIERAKAEKRELEAAELIASKKYFLPINAVKKQRSIRFAWLALLLLVVSTITVFGLLDAGVLTFVKAPTDFIPN